MVRRRSESGHVLVLALVLITLVGLSVQALHSTLAERHRATGREVETAALRALADGALAATLAHLLRDAGFAGLPPQRLGGGTVSSRVRPDSTGRIEVYAEARLGERRALLTATVELGTSGPRVLAWRHGD